MQIRAIHSIAQSGKERLFFTTDLESDAEDFLTPGFELESDSLVEMPGNVNWPLERDLTPWD